MKKTQPLKNAQFQVDLDEHQKVAHRLFHEYDFLFIDGHQGSGKTYVACILALNYVINEKKFNKIYVNKKVNKQNSLGFLPGTKDEKLEDWVAPIISNMEKIWDRENILKLRGLGETKKKGCT
jgi:predicted ribonuclease YlaK